MKWFDRWFKKKVAQAMCEEKVQEDVNYYKSGLTVASLSKSNSMDFEKAIRFTVSKANGGMVIETNFYDRHRDRSQSGLYIVRDDQDLGKEIGKIITMESLKQ